MMNYVVNTDEYKTEWFLDGKRHRENGPAILWKTGYKEWFLDGKRHRENGPAQEYDGGTRSWWRKGKRHRKDGPAIIRANGDKSWYLDGIQVSEEEFTNTPIVMMTILEIEKELGKKIRIVKNHDDT